jgi:hypothetical protein
MQKRFFDLPIYSLFERIIQPAVVRVMFYAAASV